MQSSYYSLASLSQPVDGGGSHRFNLNGYALRGFLKKPLQTSLQTILQGYQAIDAIGISYRPTPTGDVLVVEPIAFFYRDSDVLTLLSYTIIEEETAPEYLHPTAQFGYDKFPDEGPQVLDEFNTRQEYVLPGNAGTPYNQVSSLIASGYAIEQTRRVQFTDKPTDSTTYDDDCFVICAEQSGPLTTGNTSVTASGIFSTTAGKASLALESVVVPGWIAKGVSIQISGSASNNGIYKVLEVTNNFIPKQSTGPGRKISTLTLYAVLTLDRVVASEKTTITLSVGTVGIWKAERDTAFASVAGVLDPATTYNLRLSPRFNFMRHARYMAGGLFYNNGSEPIRCQFTKNNSALKTKLKSNALGDLNIDIRRLIGHADTAYVADLRAPLDPLWKPERIKVETRLTLDQMLYLKACFQGYHPDAELHYGYINLRQKDGSDLPCFPLSINYVPASGKTVLTLLKKFVPLAQPTGQRGCSFYAGYTFADFETATTGTIDNWIERCLFDNFQ